MTAPAEGFSYQYAIQLPDGNFSIDAHGWMYTWNNEADAENALAFLRQQAARLGVQWWAGTIVKRYCSPFVGPADDAEQFVDEITTWLHQQGGRPGS